MLNVSATLKVLKMKERGTYTEPPIEVTPSSKYRFPNWLGTPALASICSVSEFGGTSNPIAPLLREYEKRKSFSLELENACVNPIAKSAKKPLKGAREPRMFEE
jgi:hypothetical protein